MDYSWFWLAVNRAGSWLAPRALLYSWAGLVEGCVFRVLGLPLAKRAVGWSLRRLAWPRLGSTFTGVPLGWASSVLK
jgi:hypothetical protein